MANSKEDKGASRQERKAKKRKAEDAIPDVPEDHDGLPEPELATIKKRKRNDDEVEGKRKKIAQSVDTSAAKTEESTGEGITSGERKSKKERKLERKAKEAAERAALEASGSSSLKTSEHNYSNPPVTDAPTPAITTPTTTSIEKPKPKNNRNRAKKREAAAAALASGEAKAPRFIVFIGNLPFSATKESITKHFAAVKPKSVRHLTKKEDPTKSKGCAFLEFEGYDHMKTCLKLYHHSEFNDGISAARQINVELSAGGGGNSKERKAKIGEKNTKLNEVRCPAESIAIRHLNQHGFRKGRTEQKRRRKPRWASRKRELSMHQLSILPDVNTFQMVCRFKMNTVIRIDRHRSYDYRNPKVMFLLCHQ